MIIEAEYITAFTASNENELCTLTNSVEVRRGDVIHWNGRAYTVDRVRQVLPDGKKLVEAYSKAKL